MNVQFKTAHRKIFACIKEGSRAPVTVILDGEGADALVNESERLRVAATALQVRADLLLRAARYLEPEAFDLTLTPEEQRLAELIDDQAAWARAQAAEEAQP